MEPHGSHHVILLLTEIEKQYGIYAIMSSSVDTQFFVCREAKIHDALLFFDECEAILEDREKHGSHHVNLLLRGFDRKNGIITVLCMRHGHHHVNLLLTWQQKRTGMLVVMPIAADCLFFVCREAKIHDALLFFDECEAIFEDREKHGSHHVNLLLTEVEKHDGIIIMATNRCFFFPASSVPADCIASS